MRATFNGMALHDLDRLFQRGTAPVGDGALLGRFLAERNESAFEALVARHGPMVLGVCRRLACSRHDAEDAFQATFLVLVRKAGQLRDPERLGPWLYGVATRVAARTRTREGRHRHEALADALDAREPPAPFSDIMPVVDAELERLPAKHRDVLVMCVLEGISAEEASDKLGCPVGTVKSRLARGREALRARLVRRGIAPALAGYVISANEASAFASPVSATLIRATLKTIAASAVAPSLGALMKGAILSMSSKSTVVASVVVAGLAVAGIQTAAWVQQSQAQSAGGSAPARSAQDAAQVQNLKIIMLAFHNYEATYEHLPAAAIYGADGQPKLSWRVALLPFLDQKPLYDEFHRDEPWDSPHNKRLLGRMPELFATPGAEASRLGETRIRAFAGQGAVFEGTQGVGLKDILDGTSNTLMIAVAEEAVPWTKPGELAFIPGQPLPPLDASDPRGYLIGMLDGSVRRLPKEGEKLLRSLITRAGNEVFQWPDSTLPGRPVQAPASPGSPTPPYAPTAPVAAAGLPMPVPPSSGSLEYRALEERLRRVEEKLDRLLQKLEPAAAGAPPGR